MTSSSSYVAQVGAGGGTFIIECNKNFVCVIHMAVVELVVVVVIVVAAVKVQKSNNLEVYVREWGTERGKGEKLKRRLRMMA